MKFVAALTCLLAVGAANGRHLSQVSLFAPAQEVTSPQMLAQQFISPPPAQIVSTPIPTQLLQAYTLSAPTCDSTEVQTFTQRVQQALQNPQQLEQTMGSLLVQDRGFSILSCVFSNIIGSGQQQIQQFFTALTQSFQQIQQSNNPLPPAQSEHIASLIAEAWSLGWLDQAVKGTNVQNTALAFVLSLSNAFGGKVAQNTLMQVVDLEARFGCAPPLTEFFSNVGNVWQQLQSMAGQGGVSAPATEQFIGVQGVMAPGTEGGSLQGLQNIGQFDLQTGIQNNVRWMENHRQLHACFLAAYPQADQFFTQYGFTGAQAPATEGGMLGGISG